MAIVIFKLISDSLFILNRDRFSTASHVLSNRLSSILVGKDSFVFSLDEFIFILKSFVVLHHCVSTRSISTIPIGGHLLSGPRLSGHLSIFLVVFNRRF